MRGEACADLDGAALESANEDSAGVDGLVCAAAAAARMEETKMPRKILFMLDLRTLDSILPEMVLLDLIVLELRALPETIPTWMQTGGGVLNSNPV